MDLPAGRTSLAWPGRTIGGLSVALTLSLLPACGDTGVNVDPEIAALAGTYTAEGEIGTLVISQHTVSGDVTEDWLAAGASILLNLHGDGTTTGRFLAPGAGEDGEDMDEDLTGSWTLNQGQVKLEHDADTFLRDLDFTARSDGLTAEESFDHVTVRVVVSRR